MPLAPSCTALAKITYSNLLLPRMLYTGLMLKTQISELQPGLMPEEAFMTLPSSMERPGRAFDEYRMLPPLQQAHTLDADDLTILHHSMGASEPPDSERAGEPARVSHRLAGAWAQIELAHVRDFEGASAEAQELIALARDQARGCDRLVEREYQDHPEYFDRLYRSNLLGIYAEHFAQLGPVYWPESPTEFQRSAYAKLQEGIVEPLLDDFHAYAHARNPVERSYRAHIKGLLGELVVLQTLNRLQGTQERNEWSVAPASMRENCRNTKDTVPQELSSAFNIKCTFADQTFVPIEVKWRSHKRAAGYNSRIATVCVNSSVLNAIDTVQAMSRETGGQRLSALDTYSIRMMTDAVLESISSITCVGDSI